MRQQLPRCPAIRPVTQAGGSLLLTFFGNPISKEAGSRFSAATCNFGCLTSAGFLGPDSGCRSSLRHSVQAACRVAPPALNADACF